MSHWDFLRMYIHTSTFLDQQTDCIAILGDDDTTIQWIGFVGKIKKPETRVIFPLKKCGFSCNISQQNQSIEPLKTERIYGRRIPIIPIVG